MIVESPKANGNGKGNGNQKPNCEKHRGINKNLV